MNELKNELKINLTNFIIGCKGMTDQEIIKLTENVLKEDSEISEQDKQDSREMLKEILKIRIKD